MRPSIASRRTVIPPSVYTSKSVSACLMLLRASSTSSKVFAARASAASFRALVVQALGRGEFLLRAVTSEDIGEAGAFVEVVVGLEREGRDDLALEQAVSRLSLEPSVTSVSWAVVETPAGTLVAE